VTNTTEGGAVDTESQHSEELRDPDFEREQVPGTSEAQEAGDQARADSDQIGEPGEDPAAREPGSEDDELADGAVEGNQGPWEKGLQDGAPANAGQAGFDPDRPVRTSPPAPEEQSGVPNLPEGRNEGVEPNPEHLPEGTVAPASAPEGDQDVTGGEPDNA
jgi:hypothetical protein